MLVSADLVAALVCPTDHCALAPTDDGARCAHGHHYAVGAHGYLEVAPLHSPVLAIASVQDAYVERQRGSAPRTYKEYLRPWLRHRRAQRVLDVGCGTGAVVAALRTDGVEAYGIDIRAVATCWQQEGRDPSAFVVGDCLSIPFPDNCFDAVLALGIVEHVGTVTGHLTLAPDWRRQRARFACELQRVTRPGGRILLAGPNKWFPVDFQHGPTDEQTNPPIRRWLFERTGLNLHPTWGAYHLASYGDLWHWFGRERVRALPLQGYFGFSALERAPLPPLFRRFATTLGRQWLASIPVALRSSPLNPYVLAEIAV